MEKITLYSTGCPKCNVLITKLNKKGIPFEEITDINFIQSKGIKTVPVLELNEELLDFSSANKWINNYNPMEE